MRSELLAAIVANPDDNDLRLVYADWLAPHDPVRAELIHLSCANKPELALRIGDLERQCAARLAAIGATGRFTFERGFVSAMAAHIAIATTVPELADREPLLDQLSLTVDGQRDRVQLARPASIALLARARVLSIRGLRTGNTRYGRGPIADLRGLATIAFTRLRTLELERCRVAPAHVVALLAAMQVVPTLERLRLAVGLPAADLAQLQPAAARLRELCPALTLDIS